SGCRRTASRPTYTLAGSIAANTEVTALSLTIVNPVELLCRLFKCTQRSILIFDSDLVEVKATKQKPPHVGEVPLTREFEATITAIETKNDRSLES
ncbi:MAG TPA: hypothetical protein VNY04_05210, partial [Chthoniobacterales bacterium]|nr:hypothetical protein [Chthoniobacterales bacterium]